MSATSKSLVLFVLVLLMAAQANGQYVIEKVATVPLITSSNWWAYIMIDNWQEKELFVSTPDQLQVVDVSNADASKWSVKSHIPLTLRSGGMCFSRSARLIAEVGSQSGNVEIVNLGTGSSRVFSTGVGFYGPNGCSFSPDGKTLYLSSNLQEAPGAAKLLALDVSTGTAIRYWAWNTDQNGISKVLALPNGKVYMLTQCSSTETGDLKVLGVDGNIKAVDLGGVPGSISVSGGLAYIITVYSPNNHTVVVDTESAQVVKNNIPLFSTYGFSFPSNDPSFAYAALDLAFSGVNLNQGSQLFWSVQSDRILDFTANRQADGTDLVVFLRDGRIDIIRVTALVPLPALFENGAVNAASFAPGAPIAPGMIVAVFGTKLVATDVVVGAEYGPDGSLPAEIKGTSVLLSGGPVPIFAAAANQVNVQIPWDVMPDALVYLKVIKNGVVSNVIPIRVAKTNPGMFQWPEPVTGSWEPFPTWTTAQCRLPGQSDPTRL